MRQPPRTWLITIMLFSTTTTHLSHTQSIRMPHHSSFITHHSFSTTAEGVNFTILISVSIKWKSDYRDDEDDVVVMSFQQDDRCTIVSIGTLDPYHHRHGTVPLRSPSRCLDGTLVQTIDTTCSAIVQITSQTHTRGRIQCSKSSSAAAAAAHISTERRPSNDDINDGHFTNIAIYTMVYLFDDDEW